MPGSLRPVRRRHLLATVDTSVIAKTVFPERLQWLDARREVEWMHRTVLVWRLTPARRAGSIGAILTV